VITASIEHVSSDPSSLSPSQVKLLAFLRAYITYHGWAPTVREVMPVIEATSTSSVAYQLNQLARKGHIKRGRGTRQLALIDRDTEGPRCNPLPPSMTS